MARILRSLLCVLILLPGCGDTPKAVPMPDYGSEEGLKIAQLVSNFNEDKADQIRFRKAFAENPPANWKAYDKYAFEVKQGSPKVDGATATATVLVRLDANNADVGVKEWTFVKVGDAWKLKTAPIN